MKYYTVWYGNVSYDVLSATMTKIIKEMLPPDVRVARDAQDLLIECCVGKNLVIASSAALILFLYINDIIRMALSSDLITFQMFLCMVSATSYVPIEKITVCCHLTGTFSLVASSNYVWLIELIEAFFPTTTSFLHFVE